MTLVPSNMFCGLHEGQEEGLVVNRLSPRSQLLPDSVPRSSESLSLSTMSLCFSMSAKDWP